MGKAALNREENDKAIAELQQAAQLDPRLPFVHFNLGLAYLARADFDKARDEFLQDAEIEPDVAFDYDRLGVAYAYLQDDAKAVENFKRALRWMPTFPVLILDWRGFISDRRNFR